MKSPERATVPPAATACAERRREWVKLRSSQESPQKLEQLGVARPPHSCSTSADRFSMIGRVVNAMMQPAIFVDFTPIANKVSQ